MNRIVTNTGWVSTKEHKRAQKIMAKPGLIEIAPGFEDKAVVTVNAKPPQHDWSEAYAKLEELREEFAGLIPVLLTISISLEGENTWTLQIPQIQRKDARKLRKELQDHAADGSLGWYRKITVQGKAEADERAKPY